MAYDHLVLSTGSAPFVPPIPGIESPRVFVYRTVEDLEGIEVGNLVKVEGEEISTTLSGPFLSPGREAEIPS